MKYEVLRMYSADYQYYCTPYRVLDTLADLSQPLGKNVGSPSTPIKALRFNSRVIWVISTDNSSHLINCLHVIHGQFRITTMRHITH